MTRFFALVCVFTVLAACAPDEQSAMLTSKLSGRWSARSGSPGEDESQYIIDRNTNGTYVLHRVYTDGDRVIARSSESGKWFVQTDAYKVKRETIDGKAVDAQDLSNYYTYTLGDVGPNSVKVKSYGVEVIEKRVGQDYKLP